MNYLIKKASKQKSTILISCDTYYQVIFAIQLSLTLFKATKVDIAISDHSVNAEKVAERLAQTNCFNFVYFVKTKSICYKDTKPEKLFSIYDHNFRRIKDQDCPFVEYDEILFYGISPWLYEIEDLSTYRGHTIEWSRFEEGLLSYDTDFPDGNTGKVVSMLRSFTHRRDIRKIIKNYYCFFPDLKQGKYNWNLINVPLLKANRDILKDILAYIFEIGNFPYEQKYIYFCSSSDIDGNSYDEDALIANISDVVGTSNLLLKMHPRDNRKILPEKNITTMGKSSVPWEAIQICCDLSDRVLITCTSGSFIGINSILEPPSKAIFVIPSNLPNKQSAYIERRLKAIRKTLSFLKSIKVDPDISIVDVEQLKDVIG